MVLAFLQPVLQLTHFKIGMAVLAFSISSSVAQPFFGFLTDNFKGVWLIPAGCLFAGAGMALTGYASGYNMLLLLLFISGLGLAAYHPEASKYTRFASGKNKATAMSVFTFGGNVGFAAGPALVSILYSLARLKGFIGLLLINSLITVMLWLSMSSIKQAGDVIQPCLHQSDMNKGTKKIPYALIILVMTVIFRAWTNIALITYIPQYYINTLQINYSFTTMIITLYLISGSVGTLIGGVIADRWNLKGVIVAAMAIQIPCIYVFVHSNGFLTIISVIAAGMTIVSTAATTLVFAQELLPNNVGLASGLMLGFGVGMGGIGASVIGLIADCWGIYYALNVIIIFPLLGLCSALFLPVKPQVLISNQADH